MSQNDQSASVASCIFERIIAQNVEFSVLTTTTSITIKQMKHQTNNKYLTQVQDQGQVAGNQEQSISSPNTCQIYDTYPVSPKRPPFYFF